MRYVLSAARGYRMTMRTPDGGNNVEILQEVVRPDRSHTKVSAGTESFEAIQIGSDVYTNLGGQWSRGALPAGFPAGLGMDPGKLVEDFNRATDAGDQMNKGRIEDIDGVRCQEWIVTSTDPAQSGSMWVGLADSLPRRFNSSDGKAVITFSDWNAPITINAPM